MADVVSINGRPIAVPGEPHPDIVELAEEIAAMARSGDLAGLVVSVMHVDGGFQYMVAGQVTLATIGNLERARAYLVRKLDE